MNENLLSLQLQYGDAVYQAELYTRKAEWAKSQLSRLAAEKAAEVGMQTSTPQSGVRLARIVHVVYSNPPYGVFSRVGREVGVSASFARKVALGFSTSKRVADALIREAERITGIYKDLQKAGCP